MKGLATLSIFAFLYLVIIIIFNETAAEPRGVEDQNIGQSSVSGAQPLNEDNDKNGAKNGKDTPAAKKAKFGNVATNKSSPHTGDLAGGHAFVTSTKQAQRAATPDASQKNESNPLADLFQIGDPTMRTTLGAIYGAYKGNDQCSRKAFCMMGNYMKDMPGRDLIFLVMGNYIPPEYNIYYEIFKLAVIYGQNCEVYVCIPDAGQPDAASAAARPLTPPAGPHPQKQQHQQDQSSNQQPSRPQSLQDAFDQNDNSIPR